MFNDSPLIDQARHDHWNACAPFSGDADPSARASDLSEVWQHGLEEARLPSPRPALPRPSAPRRPHPTLPLSESGRSQNVVGAPPGAQPAALVRAPTRRGVACRDRRDRTGAARGSEAADALRAAIHAVWDASTERRAVGAWFTVVATCGHDPLARPIVGLVRATFSEPTSPRKGAAPGLARTTGIVEGLWQRFKRRMRLIHVLMGDDGPDRFVALFELSVNFHRDQIRRERERHDPYPGRCPRHIAGQSLPIAGGDAQLVASWLDALEI